MHDYTYNFFQSIGSFYERQPKYKKIELITRLLHEILLIPAWAHLVSIDFSRDIGDQRILHPTGHKVQMVISNQKP